MEGRKQRRHTSDVETTKKSRIKKDNKEMKNENKDKKDGNLLKLISKIAIICLAIIITLVLAQVIYLKVLPIKYIVPLCIGAILLVGTGIFFVFRSKQQKVFRIILSTISAILIAVFAFVSLKLAKTMDFFSNMTTETVNAKTYSVVVLKDSKYAKLEDIQYRLLLYYDNDLNQNKAAVDKLTEVMTIVTEKTDNVNELANKLIKNEVDAILIEDSYYAIIEEEIEDFRSKTKVVYTFTMEDTIETIAKNVSVTKEPFNVYISGIDTYGKISSVSRSDVNMLVSVNPQTKQVLLVNVPRDYYVKLHNTSGYRDKLTHAGIYGVDMSVKTMEDLFNTDINYYVRVNFSSLINIIDAIGGIEVYSEYNFTSKIGNYTFKKGYNQMNGKKALGFARERYAFKEGDRMRGQNQQAVIDAVIKKVCSSTTILTRFDALLDSLKGSFQTNMEYTKMIDIVRMQISDNAQWNITSIGVDGTGSSERTYSMGKTRLSVLIPYAGSVNKAKSMIKSVLNGEILEGGHVDISQYNDYPVVSRGVYETEKKEEKPKQEETTTTPSTTPNPETPNTGTTTPESGEQTPTTPTTPGVPETGTTTPDSGEQTPTTPEVPDTGTTTPESGEQTPTTPSTPEVPDTGTTTPDSGEQIPTTPTIPEVPDTNTTPSNDNTNPSTDTTGNV